MSNKSVFKEHKADLELVARNLIIKAEKFMRDRDLHKTADIWVKENFVQPDKSKK